MNRTVLRRLGLVAVVVLLLGGVGLVIVLNQPKTPRITAIVADASGVTLGFRVRAGGVDVGQIGDVYVEGNKARLMLDVDPSVFPLHQDATARIRSASLLGEAYLEVDTGSPTAPVLDPPVIPESRTSAAVTLPDVLNAADNPTSTALASLVTSLGESVQGAGPDTSAALKALRPALERTDETAAILNKQNAVLNQLVDRTQPIVDGLAGDSGRSLDGLLTSAEQTLRVTAQQRQDLEATLTELPSTVTSARRTLGQLAGTADAATPTLKSIRPVTDNLPQIVDELKRLADSADPAVASLPPVLDRAQVLLDRAAPVVDELRQAGPDLRNTAAGLKPVGQNLLDRKEHLVDLMDFVAQWSLSTNGRDGLSHYFRGVVFASPDAIEELLRRSPFGPLLESVTNARSLAAKGLPAIPAPAGAGDPGNATGLDPAQEQSMVGQLLGGR